MVKNAKESRVKQAELASALGAGIIGFGLGVYLANYLQPYALWTIVIGIALHGVAMYKKAEMKPAKLKWATQMGKMALLVMLGNNYRLSNLHLASVVLSLAG